MDIKVIRSKKTYEPICSLLDEAISENHEYQDEYIKVVVRDAKLISADDSSRYSVDREVYTYSSALSEMNTEYLMPMQPEALTIDDYKQIKEFFTSL